MSAEPTSGWCAPEVREEFPQLRVLVTQIHVRSRASLVGGSPPAIRERLRLLSDRWAGAQAVSVRQRTVPAAYRIFYRQIGLDPDVHRTPLELAVLERMMHGGFRSYGLLADILTIALVDTAVPVWALDTRALDGPLGLRVSRHGERLGGAPDGQPLVAGRLVIADASSALALLFGDPAAAYRVREDSHALTLFAVQVAGVSALHVEEALWSCVSTLEWVDEEL